MTACAPTHWAQAKVGHCEYNTDNESHKNTGLLGIRANQQEPTRQRQLATHLERLPKCEWQPEA
eukprot:3604984-Prymnesium_polylepis.1